MVSYEQNLKIDLKPTKLQSGYYAKSTDTKSPIRLTEMWETKEYDVEICRNANSQKHKTFEKILFIQTFSTVDKNIV